MLTPDTHLKERYRILQQIGGGGFGQIYKAVDEAFGCSVAIKETNEAVVNNDELRKAFEREAKLLRHLKHECLPRVTDYFFHDKAQFLVMDFIEGEDLAALLKQRLALGAPFTVGEILPYADRILGALEYLHSRPEPIVHRDIKPANIKIAGDGSVYLLDFGLAKGSAGQMSTVRDGESSYSLAGLTPFYAPVEQFRHTGTQPASDVYALGATLYHLLTGQPPAPANMRYEAVERGLEDPLKPAHQVNPSIPIAVSAVIEQAMILRWWDRLGSATEMRRALAAATPSPSEVQPNGHGSPSASLGQGLSTIPMDTQAQSGGVKTLKNSPAIVRSIVAHPFIISAVAMFLLLTLAYIRYVVQPLFTSSDLAKPGSELASSTSTATPSVFITPSSLQKVTELAGHRGKIWSVAFSADGALAASADDTGRIILWETKGWKATELSFSGHVGPVFQVAFSPTGTTLATAGNDQTIRLWDVQTGHVIKVLKQDAKAVLSVAFSPDRSGGDVLAAMSGVPREGGQLIRLWYARDDWRSKLLRLKPSTPAGRKHGLFAMAFSGDGSLLATTGYGKTITLWNLKTDELVRELNIDQPDDKFIGRLAFSPDGKYLAAGCWNGVILLWRTAEWGVPEKLGAEHTVPITALAFSPDNTTLASASFDQTLRLWRVASKTPPKLLFSSAAENATQQALAFSPDGQTLLSAGDDAKVRVWQ